MNQLTDMQTETPPLDLAHLKELEAKATQGDWHIEAPPENWCIRNELDDQVAYVGNKNSEYGEHWSQADLNFIISLHNAFPQLCRELEAARAIQMEPPNGEWFGKFGECKLCGGEIPYGHTDYCHLWKMEQEAASLQSQLSKAEGERDRMRGTMEAVESGVRQVSALANVNIETRKMLIHCADKLEAAIQPLPQTEGREVWQDIATAPKDGSKILIFDGQGIMSAWWEEEFEMLPLEETGIEVKYRGSWTDNAVESFNYEEVKEYAPTHWMPLPPAPATHHATSGKDDAV